MTGIAPTAPKVEYTGKCRLFKIDEGGETHTLAAEHVADAIREHYQPCGIELEEGEQVEVMLLEAGAEVRVEWDGETADGDVPDGGHEEDRGEGKNPMVIATAAQWAAQADATLAKWRAEKFDGDYRPSAVIISSSLF